MTMRARGATHLGCCRCPATLAAIGLALVLAASAQDEKGRTTLTYLGTAGWEISDGKTVVLVDPYLTRIPAMEPPEDTNRLIELLGPSGVPRGGTVASRRPATRWSG